jgi:hypothetical protein
METCAPPISQAFPEELMSSRQGSHASPPPSPENERAKMILAGSGRQCAMLLDQSTPLGAFSKILLESSHFGNSKQFSYAWRILDTKFGCSAFQLTQLAQITGDNGCLLLPTPIRKDAEEGSGRGHHLNPKADMKAGIRLKEAVAKLWPTPRHEGFDAGCHNGKPDSLHAAVKMLPTPTARDWKSTSPGNQENSRPLSEVVGNLYGTPTSSMVSVGDLEQAGYHSLKRPPYTSGSLNPRFVEQLMGYEIDHTDLKPSATPSSPNKFSRSCKQFTRP